jgi:hypothetical protein
VENWQIYLEKFLFGKIHGLGRGTERRGYLALLDPEATLQHPGMEKPISGDDIRGFIIRGMNTATDNRLAPTNWAARRHAVHRGAAECAHRRARGGVAGGAAPQTTRRPRAGRTSLLRSEH